MAEIDGKWKTEERARLAGSYNLCATGICTGKYYRPLRFQISAATEELTLFILFLPWIKRHPGISTGRETSVSLNLDTVVSPLPSCIFVSFPPSARIYFEEFAWSFIFPGASGISTIKESRKGSLSVVTSPVFSKLVKPTSQFSREIIYHVEL